MAAWWRSLWVLMALAVLLTGSQDVRAHRRGGLPLVRQEPPKAAPPTPAPEPEKTSGPLSLTPEAYWARMQAQAQAGETQAALETGLALVNLFPQAPQWGPTLRRLADLAHKNGELDKARCFYGFVAAWQPTSPESRKDRLALAALNLNRDLQDGDAVKALRTFLEQLAGRPPETSPEVLKEALRSAWQAVAQQVRATASPPLSLVEEVLALWDLQPEGVRPAEGALLIADLLKERGLLEAARSLLKKAGQTDGSGGEGALTNHFLELAWLSRGWRGVADTLQQGPGDEHEQKHRLITWLARHRGAGPGLSLAGLAGAGDAVLTWFWPGPARAAWPPGEMAALEEALRHSWDSPFAERLLAELARRHWVQGNFSRAAQVYQTIMEKSAVGLPPFFQDRLGLSRVKEGQTDAAHTVFQALARNSDPFWQHLAQVRLADLELSRLQSEPGR